MNEGVVTSVIVRRPDGASYQWAGFIPIPAELLKDQPDHPLLQHLTAAVLEYLAQNSSAPKPPTTRELLEQLHVL